VLAGGHPELVVYVVFGAFTGMFGRSEAGARRLRHQALAAVFLTVGVSVGVALSATAASPLALVAVEGAFAGLGSFYSDRFGLTPAGPFFGIFALGACASIRLAVPPGAAVLLCAAAAAFSLVVGGAAAARADPPSPARVTVVRRVSPLPRAATFAVAAWTAGAVTLALGIGHTHWAMAAAVVPLSAVGLAHRVTRGFHRILGTFVGLGVTAAIFVPVELFLRGAAVGAVLVILVVALQFPTELFMTRNYGLALVFFTPLILIMTELAHPAPIGRILLDRATETTLGAVVGMTVCLVAHAIDFDRL